jgi:hypothetical protein
MSVQQVSSVLRLDALTCVAMGVALVAAGGTLAPWLGLPPALLRGAGLALFPCAALMLIAARRPSAALIRVIVAGNLAWVAASLAVVLLLAPTPLGIGFVLAQAVVVALLAALEARASGRLEAVS